MSQNKYMLRKIGVLYIQQNHLFDHVTLAFECVYLNYLCSSKLIAPGSHKIHRMYKANGMFHVEPRCIGKNKSFHIVNPYNEVGVFIKVRSREMLIALIYSYFLSIG